MFRDNYLTKKQAFVFQVLAERLTVYLCQIQTKQGLV